MHPVRFIHAADLHLDTAFPGLARHVSAELANRLHHATFTALERLVALCEEEKPDFLVLAGDTYNQEDLSLKAQLAVRNACERLEQAGIRVFLTHGNHDPLSSRLQSLEWPANVKVFGDRVEAVPVYSLKQDSTLLAVIHGISHTGPRESRNLAALFQRTEEPCPQIAILHTSLDTPDGEAIYAPATLQDLAAAKMDYWALGHQHEYALVSQAPVAVYPGSLQGLHIGESGPHGCVLVTIEPDTAPGREVLPAEVLWQGMRIHCEFKSLAPVAWQVLEVNLDETSFGKSMENEPEDSGAALHTLSKLERLLRQKLDDVYSSLWQGCESMVVRIRLTGHTPLDGELRRFAVCQELLEELQESMAGTDTEIWIKDIQIDTKPVFDRQAALIREDLLGEILRHADRWRADEKLLSAKAEEALSDLYLKGRSRKGLRAPDQAALFSLLEQAERLCADYLEE